jgi:hypothetical protein
VIAAVLPPVRSAPGCQTPADLLAIQQSVEQCFVLNAVYPTTVTSGRFNLQANNYEFSTN